MTWCRHSTASMVVVTAVVGLAVACRAGDPTTPESDETPTVVTSDRTHDAITPQPTPTMHTGADHVPALHPSVDDYPQGRAILVLGDGTTWDIPILVAANDADRAHGLMEVPEIPPATGMGFVFEDDRTCCFWMKGTETDLDIAWIAVDGTVVGTTTMTVCRTDDCPSYRAAGEPAYRYALEVRAGWFAEIGLRPGDRVSLLDSRGQVPVPS